MKLALYRKLRNLPALNFKIQQQKSDGTYICSTPELSTALALNAALADGDELRAVGENGALPRTKLFDNTCPDMFELTGKFNAYTAFIGAVEYAEFLLSSVPVV